ncbi:protein of unknown function [Cupriavidus taiwanensis]|uniref:Uncharacterized protein n=1 Tax=Cupriavidus taiwanensis TaxID=164546 RepID=A0A7Z7NN43_9BURK|nr:protein of unknown function [Cupriavidus taiwanensis]SOZ03273.1 hypothetical protein CBM2597_A120003 [Cupriavidus taiwanensis]SOZ06553.1 hypothetical protein CBM2595_A81238 [Cupriavidus taiwanensis]SPC20070.1 hypothetical protein CBM2594_A90003 [Cupriavidus taiwanensis]SPD41668.1 protein of unknown function [Cupriavidus taiwanensis]
MRNHCGLAICVYQILATGHHILRRRLQDSCYSLLGAHSIFNGKKLSISRQLQTMRHYLRPFILYFVKKSEIEKRGRNRKVNDLLRPLPL